MNYLNTVNIIIHSKDKGYIFCQIAAYKNKKNLMKRWRINKDIKGLKELRLSMTYRITDQLQSLMNVREKSYTS